MAADKMTPDAQILTFRVRRIPAQITRTDLGEFLEKTIDGGLGGAENIQVGSLARSPDDWNNPAKQTATLSFKVIPPRFGDKDQTDWTIACPSLNDDLLFDTNFIGFTPLHGSGELYDCDCVAVSGLASHPFGSWRQRNATSSYQFMWLRDQLSKDFPKLRIMLYGYDTKLAGSHSSQDIDDLARTFIAHLKVVGRAAISTPPLIIFAHSLGGALVKRALYYLTGSGDAEDFMLSKIRLAVFFGVPNNGMKNEHLRVMVRNQPNDRLVRSLSIDEPYLKFLDDALYGTSVFRNLRLISVYETQPSLTTELQSDGRWARKGPLELLVNRSSAISRGSRDPQDIFHIDQNHSDLVKFSPDDVSYFTVRNIVIETLRLKPVASVASDCASTNTDLRVNIKDYLSPSSEPAYVQSIGFASRASDVAETIGSTSFQNAAQDHSLDNWQRHSGSDKRGQQLIFSDVRRLKSEDYNLIRTSLAFKEADYRYGTIETAHTATFEWIFDDQMDFMNWIRSGTKIYWIRGKPGSGKSTLMKFLHDHEQFRQAIADSSFDIPQVDMWYFFNERGTFLQKSLDGLLRTILRSLITQNPLFASLVADLYYSKPVEQRDKWSINVLNEAFSAIVRQQKSDVRLLIFLDALDEYQGFPEIICDWIQHLIRISEAGKGRTKIRICFSSRPWDSFLRAFKNNPGFSLHLHTMQDVKSYARQRLADTVRKLPASEFSALITQSSRLVDQIVKTIAHRAEGVFLWVTLALDEITATLRSRDTHSLESIVNRLPVQLEEFYLRTVLRISRGSRWRAFTMLELVSRSTALITAKELFYASSCADGSTYTECRQLLEEVREQNLSESEVSKNMLNLCNGLLEYIVENGNYALNLKYVQFIHRTARDFVMSPGFRQIILGSEQTIMPNNGHTYWLKYIIVRDRQTGFKKECLWHAHMDEKSNGRPLNMFIDSIPADWFKSGHVLDRVYLYNCLSPFIFGVIADLRLYVQNMISEQQHKEQYSMLQNQHPLHALAWSAVEQAKALNSYARMGLGLLDRSLMSAMLLDNGFDIHGKTNGLRPFDILFSYASGSLMGESRAIESPEMISLIRIFIKQGGQDPNTVIRHHNWEYRARLGWRFLPKILKESLAIHVAPFETMELLLECGANPNMLDKKGNTPLDACVDVKGGDPWSREPGSPERACACVNLLLDHGGLFTERGMKVLPKFLKTLQVWGIYDEHLAERLSKLPLLERSGNDETDFQVSDEDETDVEAKTEGKRRRTFPGLSTLKPKLKALMKKPHKR